MHTVPQQEEEDDVVILSGNPLQDEPAGLEDEDDVSPEELDDSLSGVAAEEERQWEETAEALHLPAGVTFTRMLLEDDFDFDNPAWLQGYVPPPASCPPAIVWQCHWHYIYSRPCRCISGRPARVVTAHILC